jgi:hypothetical protein
MNIKEPVLNNTYPFPKITGHIFNIFNLTDK